MVPPFVGVAVKVMGVPAHVGLLPPVTAIFTEGTITELTVTVVDTQTVLFVQADVPTLLA